MKYGINLYLWAEDMHEGLLPVLESVKQMGYDGVEVPIFDLDTAKWRRWANRLDDLGLERTANTVIAPEHNPVSPDPAVRKAALEHIRKVVDCCVAAGSSILCGPHQVALGVFTGRGATDEEWKRSVEHLRAAAKYAEGQGVVLAEEVVNRFEIYHLNVLDQAVRLVDEVDHPSCRIHFDTFHAHIEEKDPAAAIRRAGKRIAHVHVSENDRGVPGTGSVAWDATFDALDDIGYDGWLTVEAFGNFLPNLAAATKIWRPLFESEDKLASEALAFLKQKSPKAHSKQESRTASSKQVEPHGSQEVIPHA